MNSRRITWILCCIALIGLAELVLTPARVLTRTHYFSFSLNPIGSWSITAAIISAVVWFSVEHGYGLGQRGRGWLTVLGPLVLLAANLYMKTFLDPFLPDGLRFRSGWSRHRFWDAQEFVAVYILIAVAIVLARKASRLSARDFKEVGWLELIAAFGFLAAEVWTIFRLYP